MARWGNDEVNQENDNYSYLLKDVRKANDIWQYLRPDWLGAYRKPFQRQFYLKYDFSSIGYDSANEFAYRLAGLLERLEPEYLGRLSVLDIVKNPFVNMITDKRVYSLLTGRDETYGTQNNIHEDYQTDSRSHLSYNRNESVRAGITGQESSKDTNQQTLSENETMADNSQTNHVLNRYSDSPQNNSLGQETIGFTGTAGATGSESKHDHYPKVDALIAAPWNAGYLTNKNLQNQATDSHNTTGYQGNDYLTRRDNDALIRSDNSVELSGARQSGGQQGNARQQGQAYSDSRAVAARLSDSDLRENTVGLSGATVGEVWAAWNRSQELKNVIGDYVNECRKCFLLLL